MGNDFYNDCSRCNGSGTEHTWSPTAYDRPAGGGGVIVCRSCNGSGIDFYSPKKRPVAEHQPGTAAPGEDSGGDSLAGSIFGFLFASAVIFFAVFGAAMWLAGYFFGSTDSQDLPVWFMLAGLLLPFVVMFLGRREIGGTAVLCVAATAALYYFGG